MHLMYLRYLIAILLMPRGQALNMTTDMDSLILQNRAELMRQLVEVASDKVRARRLVDDLKENFAMQAYRSETMRNRYAHHKKAREAMQAMFEDNTPRDEETIKAEVCDYGGFRRGAGGLAGARMVIQKSIKLHLHGDGAKKWPLKMIDGLIGPKEWPDEWFKR